MHRGLPALVLLAASVVVRPAPAVAGPADDLIPRIDALHARRDDPAAARELEATIAAALARAPRDYATLWRAARHYFWLGDNPDVPDRTRSQIGKQGWDVAERAVAADPAGVEGHFFAAVNLGNYALAVSTWTALSQGLEGKFTAHLQRAQQIAPGYERGAIETAWGRYYAELPWPKYDAKKSEEHYRRAMAVAADNLRARAWLADLWRKEKRVADARHLATQVVSLPGSGIDPPEDRRGRRIAQKVIERTGAPAPLPAAHTGAPPPPPPAARAGA